MAGIPKLLDGPTRTVAQYLVDLPPDLVDPIAGLEKLAGEAKTPIGTIGL